MSNEMKASEHSLSDTAAEKAATGYQKIEQGVVSGYKKIEDGVVTGYKKIEDGVVTGYKKIEDGVVTGYRKLETGVVEGFGKVVDKCVGALFAKEGESVEDAKKRLSGK